MATEEKSETLAQTTPAEEAGVAPAVPKSWKYKTFRVGPWTIPCYASPPIQLVIVSFVCFMCPGMYNALTGMGGGGQVDASAANKANVALYSTFAVVGFFAGTFTNRLGIRTTLCFGGLGYSIYVASFLSYNHNKNEGFNIFAGALLGVCAGLLWCAQGAIMMSYPPEESKGKYIGWFWMIFNLGAVIGSLIPLGQNINAVSNTVVNDGTYIGFLVLTIVGAVLAWTLVDAKDVIRHDGSRIILMKNPTWWTEIRGLGEVFMTDPYIVLLFPMFIASNWFYAYHFNGVNLAMFNTRTRALNGVIYYVMQIFGAMSFGYALDRPYIRRTTRARVVWVVLMVLTMVIWGGGYVFQKKYTRDLVTTGADTEDDPTDDYVKLDWTDSGYIGPMFLYLFYGFYDAAWQTTVYWYMGAITNNGRKLANFAGFYKGIQSAGGAIMWRLDDIGTPYMTLFASCWGLLAGSLIIAVPVILLKIKESVAIEEDLMFSDETVQDVIPGASLKEARE
ncbi:MFS general substrate transporter [Eremomyces bilateralis CBS 781.70]|uniref:MFS general substrate transporter n=1 Tax=Eremomyces bilateralis CBS 781.70 TaxID=1392243 RepID=A0A6G1G9V3_9PEZI|nr:MFS general substrate transporter [Eremomyces bilateralis CBS 781.70]KAF1814858.1 MFS general substrate transporter [Eremomyces bilateralis CBS 781.70]